jgi:transposase
LHQQLPTFVSGNAKYSNYIRREVWSEARKKAMTPHANKLKGTSVCLWRKPEDLTPRQEHKLAWIAKVNPKVDRANLIKEHLKVVISKKE